MRTESRFGKKVRGFRIDRGWSQEQLAEIAGLATRTVQRVEKDQTQDGETLKAIAAAFNVAVKDMRTNYWVAESQPPKSLMIESADAFRVAIQRAHHFYSYQVLGTPRPDVAVRVNQLVEAVFADIWAMDPDEPGLLSSFVDSIREPLQELKNIGLSFFSIQQQRDVFINGAAPAKKIPMEDVTYGYFFLVPTHGCFRRNTKGKTEPLHKFSSDCEASVNTLLDIIKRESDMFMAVNAIYAMCAESDPDTVVWCDNCFPQLEDGSRISWEYLESITGLSRDQLAEVYAQVGAALSTVDIQPEMSKVH